MFNEFILTLIFLCRKIKRLNNEIKIRLDRNVNIIRDYTKIEKQSESN